MIGTLDFAWPWLLLLWPLPWLVRRILPAYRQQPVSLRVPATATFAAMAPAQGHGGRSAGRWPLLLLWLVWTLLLLAVARPQLPGEPVALPASGRDLFLAVDLSGSMNRRDMTLNGNASTRLDVVKAVLDDFIPGRDGDRVGLILFGSSAYLQAPLSFDVHTINRLLQESPLGIAGSRTAVGDAIGLALRRLRERPAANRVLILLTDGASNAGELEPAAAAELAASAGIRIHAIGFATTGEDATPNLDALAAGSAIGAAPDIDEDTLQAVAAQTGGRYFRATDGSTLAAIYQTLDHLEPVPAPGEVLRPARPMFHWPLAIALALSLALVAVRPISKPVRS